ncbi:Murein L,D-transpeptidase YcbB/YkuD|nr:Murein L,D-transpeptidase YcbB/YkuD [Candidatus Pantoea persica]
MLGYLQFVSSVPTQGESWFYNNVPYKLAQPSVYAPMSAVLRQLLADTRPWPQLKNRETLHPGQVSDDVPALREILRRNGMLSAQIAAPMPADDAVPTAQVPVSQSTQPTAVSLSTASVSDLAPQTPQVTGSVQKASADRGHNNVYDATLVEAVKRFQQWQELGTTPSGRAPANGLTRRRRCALRCWH